MKEINHKGRLFKYTTIISEITQLQQHSELLRIGTMEKKLHCYKVNIRELKMQKEKITIFLSKRFAYMKFLL